MRRCSRLRVRPDAGCVGRGKCSAPSDPRWLLPELPPGSDGRADAGSGAATRCRPQTHFLPLPAGCYCRALRRDCQEMGFPELVRRPRCLLGASPLFLWPPGAGRERGPAQLPEDCAEDPEPWGQRVPSQRLWAPAVLGTDNHRVVQPSR